MRVAILITISLITSQLWAQNEEDLNNKGLDLMEEEKYKQALPIFNQLVDLDPTNTTFRYNRAVTLFNLKQYQKALLDYKELITDVPNESEYFFQTGNIYEHMDSLKQASNYYSQAIALESDYFLYYFKRGTVQLKDFQWSLAIRDFDKSIELNPEHHNSFHNRGIAYYKLGLKEKGCNDWCEALLKGNTKSATHLEKNCSSYPKPCLLDK